MIVALLYDLANCSLNSIVNDDKNLTGLRFGESANKSVWQIHPEL